MSGPTAKDRVNPRVAGGFTYTGETTDASTGLEYLRARYYDPAVGAFISRDPVPTGNRYAYAGGSPVNASDPSGLFCASSETRARITAKMNDLGNTWIDEYWREQWSKSLDAASRGCGGGGKPDAAGGDGQNNGASGGSSAQSSGAPTPDCIVSTDARERPDGSIYIKAIMDCKVPVLWINLTPVLEKQERFLRIFPYWKPVWVGIGASTVNCSSNQGPISHCEGEWVIAGQDAGRYRGSVIWSCTPCSRLNILQLPPVPFRKGSSGNRSW